MRVLGDVVCEGLPRAARACGACCGVIGIEVSRDSQTMPKPAMRIHVGQAGIGIRAIMITLCGVASPPGPRFL